MIFYGASLVPLVLSAQSEINVFVVLSSEGERVNLTDEDVSVIDFTDGHLVAYDKHKSIKYCDTTNQTHCFGFFKFIAFR